MYSLYVGDPEIQLCGHNVGHIDFQ